MNTLDIVLIVILGVGIIHGLFKGFILSITTLLALVLGIWGAARFSYFSAVFISERFEWNEEIIHLTALAITFLAIVLLVNLLGKLVDKLASAIALGLLNRLLGGVFGLIKSLVMLSLVIAVFNYFGCGIPFISDDVKSGSLLYGMLENASGLFISWFGEISI